MMGCIVGVSVGSVRAGTFKNPSFIPTAFDPIGVAAVDLNRDGNLDLVYVDGSNPYSIHTLLGKGDGTFGHGQDIAIPAGLCSSLNCPITVADINNDGNLDLILGGGLLSNNQTETPEVGVFLGNGDGTFQPVVVSLIQLPNNPFASFSRFAVGDVNGDGATDLVVVGTYIYVLSGDNTGKFSLSSEFLANMSAGYLADINGDGKLDLVATDTTGAGFLVFIGNGNGTFQPAVAYNNGSPTGTIIFSDLDGDGHPDIIAATSLEQIVIFKGNSDGTFASAVPIARVPTNATLVGTGDYNADGIADLLFLTPAGVGVLPGKGNLSYGNPEQSLSGGISFQNSLTIGQGDFNKDGHLDIAMAAEGGIVLLFGNGDGTFRSADLYDVGQPVGGTAVADFNNDGFPDIAVTLPAPVPRILFGNGLGLFNLGPDPNLTYGSQQPNTNIAVGDFNGDRNSDLVAQYTASFPNSGPEVLFGLGNGALSAPVTVPDGSTTVADLNNDGRSDLVSVSGTVITANLGQANGTFLPVTTTLRIPANPGTATAVGDVNGDGKPDLIFSDGSQLEVWLGVGDGTFQYSGSFGISGQSIQIAQVAVITDLDGDGKADFVLMHSVGVASVAIFYGHGDGTFQTPTLLPISHQYSQLAVADINRDNRPDLILSDGVGIAVMLNIGTRSFGPEEHFVAGQAISAVNVTDVNGDGYPDIVTTNPGGTTVAVLLNQPNGTPPGGSASNDTFNVSPEPANYGQPITLQMTVSAATTGAPQPTGSVSFSVDGGFLATLPLQSGTASYDLTRTLPAGSHTLVAAYNGDVFYGPQNLSVNHVVLPPVFATTTTLTAVPTSLLTSQTVRLTAAVTTSGSPLPGLVTFFDGTTVLGARTLDLGRAVFDTAELSAGAHTVIAKYQLYTSFAGIFLSSTSAPVSVTVTGIATNTTLSSSALTPTAGAVVTFTGSVSSAAGVPFGGLTFYDGGFVLGTAVLGVSGSATFSTAPLTAGTHIITAAFYANATFAASTATPLSVSVASPPSSALFTSTALSFENNTDGTGPQLLARVATTTGFTTGTVTFLDGGNILGVSTTDEGGTATLPIPSLGSGTHLLAASFAGTSHFAPSVSPGLHEQWPAAGPGFSLSIDAGEMHTPTDAPTHPGVLHIHILPFQGFNQQVQLSCGNVLPVGYSCIFSPQSLVAGGTSDLRIQSSKVAENRAAAAPLHLLGLCLSFALLSYILPIGAEGRRRFLGMISLLVFLGLSLLVGCAGVPSSVQVTQQSTVVSIEATSGTGANTIVHSAQVSVSKFK